MRRFCCLLLLCCCAIATAWGQTTVSVWTYYDGAPFGAHALTDRLCAFLNARSDGRWSFAPVQLPRKRIDRNLRIGESGLVAWVNPTWFQDPEQRRYLWTQGLIWGRNQVVSLRLAPVPYRGPESLAGKVFGGVLGHRYHGIDELVAEGRILREDTGSFDANLRKLLNGRLDVTLIPDAELYQLLARKAVRDRVFVAELPQQEYQRMLLISSDLAPVKAFIDAQLPALIADDQWQSQLSRYGLSAVAR